MQAAGGQTGIDGGGKPAAGFILAGSYPNPARAQTIQYSLPRPSRVVLQVFDIRGALVAERKLGRQDPGPQAVFFDGRDLGRGLYFYRLTMSSPETDAVQTRLTGRMILID
jgi:hypothetical protein